MSQKTGVLGSFCLNVSSVEGDICLYNEAISENSAKVLKIFSHILLNTINNIVHHFILSNQAHRGKIGSK